MHRVVPDTDGIIPATMERSFPDGCKIDLVKLESALEKRLGTWDLQTQIAGFPVVIQEVSGSKTFTRQEGGFRMQEEGTLKVAHCCQCCCWPCGCWSKVEWTSDFTATTEAFAEGIEWKDAVTVTELQPYLCLPGVAQLKRPYHTTALWKMMPFSYTAESGVQEYDLGGRKPMLTERKLVYGEEEIILESSAGGHSRRTRWKKRANPA